MKLTIYEIITIKLLIRSTIEEYQERIKLFNADKEDDIDFILYYNLRIEELQEILLKL
jgi:hypothetical protein